MALCASIALFNAPTANAGIIYSLSTSSSSPHLGVEPSFANMQCGVESPSATLDYYTQALHSAVPCFASNGYNYAVPSGGGVEPSQGVKKVQFTEETLEEAKQREKNPSLNVIQHSSSVPPSSNRAVVNEHPEVIRISEITARGRALYLNKDLYPRKTTWEYDDKIFSLTALTNARLLDPKLWQPAKTRDRSLHPKNKTLGYDEDNS